jgi:hypothetical protein
MIIQNNKVYLHIFFINYLLFGLYKKKDVNKSSYEN